MKYLALTLFLPKHFPTLQLNRNVIMTLDNFKKNIKLKSDSRAIIAQKKQPKSEGII
jgi:hypothetical protein